MPKETVGFEKGLIKRTGPTDPIRLIDHIRSARTPIRQEGAAFLDEAHFRAQEEVLRLKLEDVPVIVADQVDLFVYTNDWHEDATGAIDVKATPNVVPPFSKFWIEWKVAAEVPARTVRLVGALVEAKRVAEDTEMETASTTLAGRLTETDAKTTVRAGSWLCEAQLFLLDRQQLLHHVIYQPGVLINPEAWVEWPYIMGCTPFARNVRVEPEEMERWKRYARAWMFPIVVAMMLMNTSGVKVPHVERHETLNAEHHKRHGKWLSSYSEIEIWPKSDIFWQEARDASGNISFERARHLCRQHFRVYTPENPMFGPGGYVGNVLVRQHLRGNSARGEIKQSYKLRLEGKKRK